jgi:predicted nucleic acid-binding protein
LAERFQMLGETSDSSFLAQEYLREGIFPRHAEDDARHVAIATAGGADFVVSWNFRHLVRVRTRRAVNLVNALKGRPIEIIAPPEL